jgi:NTP pyrophosphatase (non-canonical NTP hydrolase)
MGALMSYGDFVRKTCNPSGRDLITAVLGLCGEAGEVADLIKKSRYKGIPLDNASLLMELGDVLWYAELVCQCLGVTREQVEALNIAKLEARYK